MSTNEQFSAAQLAQLKILFDAAFGPAQLGKPGAPSGQQAGGGGTGSESSNPTVWPGTGAVPPPGGTRTDPKRPDPSAAVGGLAKKQRSGAQTASGRSSEKEEKSDRSDGDHSDEDRGGEDEEDDVEELLCSYDFFDEAFEKAKYSQTLFTTVLSADQKSAALRALNTRPANAPKVAIPDLTTDPLVTDLPKHKIADINLKVKDIAPLFKALARVDDKLALLILNLIQLLGETDADNKEQVTANLATAQAIAERMASVAAVGRSEKAAFKAALFMHAKQKKITLATALKIINKKETASVFADPHVMGVLSQAANFNDQITDIGAAVGSDGNRTFFRDGREDRRGVQRAQVLRRYGDSAPDFAPQRGRGRGRGNPRGGYRGSSRGNGRGSARGSNRGSSRGRGQFNNY